jgi:hypothetical protein
MKKKFVSIIVFAIFLSTTAFSQFSFSVGTGLNINNAYFGYKAGKFVPFAGVQIYSASGMFKNTGTEWDYEDGAPVNYTDEIKMSGMIIMPELGVKYFAVEKNKLKGYLIAGVTKPFLNAKVSDNGEEVEEIQESLDKVSLLGGFAGVGAEYFLDENFSIGGEFGMQMITGSYKDEYTDEYWNPATSQYIEADFVDDYRLNFAPTYAKISLNFYF